MPGPITMAQIQGSTDQARLHTARCMSDTDHGDNPKHPRFVTAEIIAWCQDQVAHLKQTQHGIAYEATTIRQQYSKVYSIRIIQLFL